MRNNIVTVGGFDRMDSGKVRFFQEVAKSGTLDVVVFDDGLVEELTGSRPKFPLSERVYFIENVRYVDQVNTISSIYQLDKMNQLARCDEWISLESEEVREFRGLAEKRKMLYSVISDESLKGFPEHDYDLSRTSDSRVVVTGCFDWFHTGHIRFFEEASEYGDLYVILGHDKNLEQLKGPGHPMFSQEERKYLAGSIRFVKQALISSGQGWLDAKPEIEKIQPDRYVVNEDGDKKIKRNFCEENGIEYVVLKRKPKPGLKARTSTDLRGF